MSRTVKWAAVGLAVLTFVRLWVAAVTPLAPDEAYYWVWSRALAAGYLDHPPMVALWIRAGTELAGSNALGVRLFGPLSAALGSWLLYDAAERLFPGRGAGLTAAALLNATLVLGVGAVIMTPDTPLLLFWTATLWAGARLASGGAPGWWLAAGVFSGLALLSKYTAAFLPIGLGLFAIIAVPRWWRRPGPWVGGLIAGLLFLPVVLWNSHREWVGFLRQGGRVADWRPERAVGFLAELTGGQIGLATPGIFVLLVAGVIMAIRVTARSREPAWSLLAALSVPPVLVFLQHAFGDRVQGNWPAILYPAAAVAASGLVAPAWRRLTWPSCGLGFAITAIVYAHVVTGWPGSFGARDPVARQLFGWADLAARVEAARREAGADFITAEPYGLAAELAWELPPGVGVIGADAHWLWTVLPRAREAGSGVVIVPERYGMPDLLEWRDAVRLPDIVRTASGADIERYGVFLVRGANGPPSAVTLPRR
jgi:4-amino-4-deoxy-L-arabinose transferase-like glycosyltransferase